MKKNILKPNYDRSILSISSSILKNYNINSSYKTLKELDNVLKKGYKNVVFLIIDCLGECVLNKHCSEEGFFKKHYVTSVTSVFPPTTAAATTAFHSGVSPFENGWIGWMPYFSEYNCMVELFSGKDFYKRTPVVDNINKTNLKFEEIYSIIERKNKEVTYHKIFPSFSQEDSFLKICDGIKSACKNEGNNIISAYWTEPDHTIHHNGVYSNAVRDVVRDIELKVEELTKELDDTVVIISADHGAVDVEEIYINEIEELNNCLLLPPSIESRFVSFFIKDGMNNEFEAAIKKYIKDGYLLYKKEDFFKDNLLGNGKEHERIKDYIGDYVLILYNNLNIRYSITGKRDKKHIADHGGITKEEMLVPVIVIEKG